jgi:hypothetical protein
VAVSQLKSIILAYTELKYHQQDIYQISSAEIGRVLRELNENNNRLLDHKSTNPPAVVPPPPPPPSVTALLSTATPTVLTVSPVRYQLVSVPVTATSVTTTLQQLRSVVSASAEVKLPLDHDYSVQRGALRVVAGEGSADKTTSVVVVLKEDVITRGINVSSALAGTRDTPVISSRYFCSIRYIAIHLVFRYCCSTLLVRHRY